MKKEVKETVTSLSATSKTNKSRCQVSLFKKDAIAMLTVFSDYGKVVSIVSVTKLLYLCKDKKSNNNNNSTFLFCRKFTLLQNIKEQ
jgi:CBS-domain-containing membrane protein